MSASTATRLVNSAFAADVAPDIRPEPYKYHVERS